MKKTFIIPKKLGSVFEWYWVYYFFVSIPWKGSTWFPCSVADHGCVERSERRSPWAQPGHCRMLRSSHDTLCEPNSTANGWCRCFLKKKSFVCLVWKNCTCAWVGKHPKKTFFKSVLSVTRPSHKLIKCTTPQKMRHFEYLYFLSLTCQISHCITLEIRYDVIAYWRAYWVQSHQKTHLIAHMKLHQY